MIGEKIATALAHLLSSIRPQVMLAISILGLVALYFARIGQSDAQVVGVAVGGIIALSMEIVKSDRGGSDE
jgi:hypothetical protein